jgi:hypothetical protein
MHVKKSVANQAASTATTFFATKTKNLMVLTQNSLLGATDQTHTMQTT